MENKLEKLREVLERLNGMEDILACLIATKDGILVTVAGNGEIDMETVAAMSATIFGAARAAAKEINSSQVDNVVVHTDRNMVIVNEAGEKLILVCIAKKESNLGAISIEMRRAALEISKIY